MHVRLKTSSTTDPRSLKFLNKDNKFTLLFSYVKIKKFSNNIYIPILHADVLNQDLKTIPVI